MQKGWVMSLGLAALALLAAAVVTLTRPAEPQVDEIAAGDTCFRYGRLECCVLPEK